MKEDLKQHHEPPAHADKRRQHRNTWILVLSLAVILLTSYFLLFPSVRKKGVPEESLTAVIQVNDKTVHKMDLGRDEEYTFRDGDGHYNTVAVRDGAVMVTEADCKNQVCVKTGQIRYPGEVIACLPHRLIIYIE